MRSRQRLFEQPHGAEFDYTLDRKETELRKGGGREATASLDREHPTSVKTAELLRQGEAFFARGSYQRAIHVWTRIFFLDRRNPKARKAIDRAKRALAERQRQLDAELAAARRSLDAADVDTARRLVLSVLATDPRHAEGHQLAEKISALERRAGNARSVRSQEAKARPPTTKGGVVVKVPRRRGSRPVRHSRATSFLKMAAFMLATILLFSAGALYLHLNWEWIVSDGAFGASASAASTALSGREEPAVPDPSELRYYNGARLASKGFYREALAELRGVDRSSAVAASARSLVLRIEQRLLREASELELPDVSLAER